MHLPALPKNTSVVTALVIQRLATRHAGRAKGVRADVLASAMNMTERTLRKAVSEAREHGIAIAGTPVTGYYVATNPEELAELCAFLRSRAMHSLRLISRLQQIALPDLLHQMRLNT
jgi:hypothetical protein